MPVKKISFLDCPHRNVQTYTEYCLDCGHNLWTTKEQYLKELRKQDEDNDPVVKNIRALEKKLGIG